MQSQTDILPNEWVPAPVIAGNQATAIELFKSVEIFIFYIQVFRLTFLFYT